MILKCSGRSVRPRPRSRTSSAKRSGEQLVELAVQIAARRQILAPFEHPVLPAIIAHEAAGFLDQQYPRRSIPNVEVVFPETVESTGRNPRKIERCRTEAANPANLRCDGAE